jgi:hypothetical protein
MIASGWRDTARQPCFLRNAYGKPPLTTSRGDFHAAQHLAVKKADAAGREGVEHLE